MGLLETIFGRSKKATGLFLPKRKGGYPPLPWQATRTAVGRHGVSTDTVAVDIQGGHLVEQSDGKTQVLSGTDVLLGAQSTVTRFSTVGSGGKFRIVHEAGNSGASSIVFGERNALRTSGDFFVGDEPKVK